MNENYDDYHNRNTTRTFIYTKSKKKCEMFLYTKTRTLFKKLDNFCYVLYTKTDFHEIFEVGIYIQKA